MQLKDWLKADFGNKLLCLTNLQVISRGGFPHRSRTVFNTTKWPTQKRLKLKINGICIRNDKNADLEVAHQTRRAVFDHISKHRDAQRSVSDEPRDVWKCGQILSSVFDKSSQSKLKLWNKRKNRTNPCLLRSDIQTTLQCTIIIVMKTGFETDRPTGVYMAK